MIDDLELPEPKTFNSYKPAGLLARFLALLIDIFIISFIMTIFINPNQNTDQFVKEYLSGKYLALQSVIFFTYTILLESTVGATLGKMIFKIKVINEQEKTPHNTKIALRNLVKYFFLTFQFAGFFALFFMNIDQQFLHDSWSKCYIVQSKKKNEPQPEN